MKHFGSGRWRYQPVAAGCLDRMIRASGLPPPLAEVLCRRGIEEERVREFLEPGLQHLPDPMLLKGMDRATTILAEALRQGRPIVIYADYDVDGLTGAAILHQFFQEMGRTVPVVQPDRFSYGYGVHRQLIEEIGHVHGRGAVLVTVDCGISDAAAIAAAKQAGLSVIVSDHHLPPAVLPPADAVINPRQEDCPFPFKGLAGAGVAFYLLVGLRRKLRQRGYWKGGEEPNLRRYLDLAAIGTVCDMVGLQEVNRVLVRVGLEVLTNTCRPGLIALKGAAGYRQGQLISAFDVGYRLGPRLNAAGRMGAPRPALELLLATDSQEAERLAAELDEINARRREETERTMDQAIRILADVNDRQTLLVGGRDWHVGVLGIVASRLQEEYYRPTIVYSIGGDGKTARASGRSVEGFDLYKALAACGDLLERFGGHAQAAGLCIPCDRLLLFRERFESEARRAPAPEKKPKAVDAMIVENAAGWEDFLRYYKQLMPFGEKNPEPVFAMCNCLMHKVTVLKDSHLRCGIRFGERLLPGIGFGLGGAAGLENERVDAVFALRPNFFRGEEQWQAHLFSVEKSVTT